MAVAAASVVLGCSTMEAMTTSSSAKSPAAAKPPIAYGKPISEGDIALWNIDIRTPDGKGLPAGSGTVPQGKQVYEAKCAACHGVEAKGGPQYGTMVGGIGSFTTDKRILTPGSMYPYAPILFDYIRRAMPMDRPQSLSADEVYAVSAYLLHLNGLIPTDAVMDAKTLPQVQMPNRNGFILDDRPDTQAVRCMRDCTK
jgi:cytochrome c